jgi:hypothetical protein
MVKREEPPLYSAGQWQKVGEFSLHSELGCEQEAQEKIAEILASAHITGRALIDTNQAVTTVMEKEISSTLRNQTHWTFTIFVNNKLVQSLRASMNLAENCESSSGSSCWGFFLTEKRTSETMSSITLHHIDISIHLYQEGSST